jgi:hypothetical protein
MILVGGELYVMKNMIKSKTNNMSVLDWLKEQLESYGDPFKCEIEWTELDELIEQAKEKELNEQTDMSN